MTEDPKKDDDGAAEFQRVLENLVNTPHKPHVEKKEGREPKPAPKVDYAKTGKSGGK